MWCIGVVTSSSLAVIEANSYALYLSIILLPFAPLRLSITLRLALLSLAPFIHFLGPGLLLLAVPLAMVIAKRALQAVSALMLIAAVGFLYPQFQNIPDISGQALNVGSSGFFIIPGLVVIFTFLRDLKPLNIFILVVSQVVVFLILDTSVAGGWLTPSQFSDPAFRLIVTLVSPFIAALGSEFRSELVSIKLNYALFLLTLLAGSIIASLLPSEKISHIVFDESHGKWETVQASFGPNEFGRSANYTYSLLFNYSKRLVKGVSIFVDENKKFPEANSAFVIKMPTKKLSKSFIDRAEEWVSKGGKLIVVADHTDLYDTTQHLNQLLKRFKIKLKSDAVYDPKGLPNEKNTAISGFLFGSVDADGKPFPWQTGASLENIPLNAITLATYGLSFSEQGDYSKQNRFGPFIPRLSLRFGDHTAVMAVSLGKGAVAVILDSTPWSNFSIFKEVYRKLFRSILQVISSPKILEIAGWSSSVLFIVAIIFGSLPGRITICIGGLILGLALGTHAKIGFASFGELKENRDYKLKILAGSSATFQFLKQLVQPGARNFSRIVSSTAKYGLMPSASSPGAELPNLVKAKKWLIIEPNADQLPDPKDIITHLRMGGDISILFAPEQSISPRVIKWLKGLGLIPNRSIGLSVSEDRKSIDDTLLTRRGRALMKDIRVVTIPLPTSILKEHGGDFLYQRYTSRPTTFPRSSGFLNISFSSDQFSDDAIGDVWEGIEPSSIGKLREKQFAFMLTGKEPPNPFPKWLEKPHSFTSALLLKKYAVLRDGNLVIKGTLESQRQSIGRPTPEGNKAKYLIDLRNQAASFVAAECQGSKFENKIRKCEKRFLGSDLVEWIVSWKTSSKGSIAAIELLHERRFSGLGSTWNVLFTE